MKRLIFTALFMLLTIPAFAQQFKAFQPGTLYNPYIIQRTGPGQSQMSTYLPDMNQPMWAPGQPYNPYIIKQTPQGTTIGTRLPGGLNADEFDD